MNLILHPVNNTRSPLSSIFNFETSNNPLIGVSSNNSGGFSGQSRSNTQFGTNNSYNTSNQSSITPIELLTNYNSNQEPFTFNETSYTAPTSGFKIPENNAYANINPIDYFDYSATEYYSQPDFGSVFGSNLLFNDLIQWFCTGKFNAVK